MPISAEAQANDCAVIYTRVSDPKQRTQGDGLRSQETRCREYAGYRSYRILKVFQDDMSGSTDKRPGMQAMLQFLRSHRNDKPVVIIDDISRFARDVTAHWKLRETITKAGGRLESPSIEFGESSDAIFYENMMASMAQHHRQKNAEQVKNRQRARMMNGYWCFHAPKGYRYEPKAGHGKVMVRDDPLASIIQEALEAYATGRFTSKVEVKRFLESQPSFPKELPNGEIRQMTVNRLLEQPLYAGLIERPNWGISLRKAQHEGLISVEHFNSIQKRLKDKPYAPARKDIKQDFPLRGAVNCSCCERPLTSGWSKGKYKRYPYYLCQHQGCEMKGKSIPRAQIEDAFTNLLSRLSPTPRLFKLVEALLRDVWDQRTTQTQVLKTELRKQLETTDKEIASLLGRIIKTTNDTVITAYEKRISELERQKLALKEKQAQNTSPQGSFEQKFEHSMRFLANPQKLWDSGDFEDKRNLLKYVFGRPLVFSREQGFRTPSYTAPFAALEEIFTAKKSMVPLTIKNSNSLFNTLADWNKHFKKSSQHQ